MNDGGGADRLDALLDAAHEQLGIAVYDGLTGQGGPPEPRDPDTALDRLLAAAHRQTLSAVVRRTERLRRAAPACERRGAGAGFARSAGVLMRRPAAVRLKYREQALRIARDYWPQDLDESVRRARDAVQELIVQLEAESLPETSRERLARVGDDLGRVLALPRARRLPPALTGYDYLEVAQARLSERAARLMDAADAARTLLEAELIPRLGGREVSWAGALEVAEDLADDLDVAYQSAVSLLGAVTEAEEAGNDFRGADLHTVALDGVRLEGVRWDEDTAWPPGWEQRIRRVSLAAGDGLGVLVVGPQPYDSAVAADL
ncbi:hypothetical protein [Streptomyces jumonjinensis]|uniref:hypothetical protein n=1 Tax=Streptomyces jumonjinensis TaxID=1945 RepID=UPI0037AC4016